MRGPAPKPLELRVLHGKAGAERMAAHPKPRRVLPRCPEHLEGEAARCWKRLARDLFDAGLLTAVDRDALASYCQVYARWVEAEAKVKERGAVSITKLGNVVQNPFLAVANRALDQMLKLQAEFGMTPSSRSRVKAEVAAARREAQQPERARVTRSDDAEDPRRALGS